MYLKIHEDPAGRVVAVCDRELLGKVLEDENAHMDLDKYRDFYVGELAKEEAVRDALDRFGSANLVGERAVGVALSMELVAKEDVMYINETPYIQIYKL